MSTRLANRIAGISGMLWIVLILVGFGAIAGFGSPMITAPKADVGAYFVRSDPARVYVGEYIEILGFLLLAVFAARLWALLSAAEGALWLSTLAFGGALLHIALSIAGIAPLIAATYRAAHGGLDEDAFVALNDLRVALYWMSLLVAPLFLVPAGLLIARISVFPRWLGWAAIVIGAALLLGLIAPTSGVGDVASLLMALWAFVVGIFLVVRANHYGVAAQHVGPWSIPAQP